jgi:hypothetical protein
MLKREHLLKTSSKKYSREQASKKIPNTELVELPFARGLLPAGSYAFYSPFLLGDAACEREQSDCFYREIRRGAGTVYIQLGLPLVANGMLGRADNRNFALALAGHFAEFAFDEYHHFATEKTLADSARYTVLYVRQYAPG